MNAPFHRELLQVSPSATPLQTVEAASCILETSLAGLAELSDSDIRIYGYCHLIEMAKALIDAAQSGLGQQSREGTA